jgi:ABC-type glycerol-3-phosphate transport system permease component
MSKPVTATATLVLVQQGKLSLDENVNDKLKTWKVPENEFTKSEKVTLRRILSHTAGLTVHAFPGYDIDDPLPTVVQILRALELQRQIWSQALTASRADQSQNSARLLLPALNEMIDVTTSRAIAVGFQLPALMFYLLICIALLTGLLAGYAMSKRQSRSWFHMFLYALIIPITICAIFDFDNPRFGLIKADAADTALLQLRDSIR